MRSQINNTNHADLSDQQRDIRADEEDEKPPTSEEKFDNLMKSSRSLAHELNNQLTTILANTQLVLLMAEDESLKTYLDAVEEAAGTAGNLVHKFQESIRALAKIS